jgi:putative peptide zinc metalloprotease protein
MSTFQGEYLKDYQGFDREMPIDALEKKRTYLIISKNGAQIRVSSSAYQLLRGVTAGRSIADLAREFNKTRKGEEITTQQLEDTFQDTVKKLRNIEERSSKFKLPWAFWIRLRLIPTPVVHRVSSVLSFLYRPHICGALLVGIGFAIFGLLQHVRITATNSTVWWGYLLYVLSLLFHEFGHSAACAWFGAPPREIGFTVYLIYPAFYSDVSSAWRLSRWQRVIVDLGGNYFQLVAAFILAVAFWVSHWAPLRVAGVMILYTCVFSLNPFFKFDGYWVLADMLGVTNLASQPVRIWKHLLALSTRRSTQPLPWPLPITCILLAYSLVTTCIWTIFTWRLCPLVWSRVTLFVHNAGIVANRIALGQLPHWTEWRPLVVSTPMLLTCVIMVWNLGRTFLRPLISRLPTVVERSREQMRPNPRPIS